MENLGNSFSMRRIAAWSVHLFTASGAVFGLFALLAVENQRPRSAFLWILATLVIDGLDGSLARLVKVNEQLPRFQGFYLDLIVDYFTYVIVPAMYLYHEHVLPRNWEVVGACVVLVASQYHSGNLDQKTEDFYFRGFPAWWSVLIFYIWLFHTPAWVNLAVVFLFAAATFSPILFMHPLRVREWPWLTRITTVAWAVVNTAILVKYPSRSRWLVAMSVAGLTYLAGICVVRTLRGKPFRHE